MDTKRKIIVLTRHGDTPEVDGERQDAVTDKSVRKLYDYTGSPLASFVRENNVSPQKVFLRHSDKKRTFYTGEAILAGALGFKPIPQSQDDLDKLDFSGVDIQEHTGLGYEGVLYNEAELKKDLDGYIAKWFSDPKATTYEGIEITPYNEVIGASRKTLVDALGLAVNGEKGLGVLASHASIVEALTINAINSGRKNPVKNFDELGGLFEREEFATIFLDHKNKSSSYKAKLEREGKNYKMDLSSLGF